MNKESENIWNGSVVTYCEVQYWQLLVRTEEHHDSVSIVVLRSCVLTGRSPRKCTVHAMKLYGTARLSRDPFNLCVMQAIGRFHARVLLPWVNWTGELGGSHRPSGRSGQKKHIFPLPRIETRYFGCPTHSLVLGSLNPYFAENMLPTTQCYVARGNLPNEKTALNHLRGKRELKLRSCFENLRTIGLWRYTLKH
jgi:hypothetical protein